MSNIFPRFNFFHIPLNDVEDYIIGQINKFEGYIDVGDGCWRRNVLVTTLRCG